MNLFTWKSTEATLLSWQHNDLDGIGPEIVLRSSGYNPVVQNLNNSEVDEYIKEHVTKILNGTLPAPGILLITDISPSAETAVLLEQLYQEKRCELLLLDHHKHALHLNQYEWARVIVEQNGVKQCATSLLFHFLIDEVGLEEDHDLRYLVEEIRQYDTWDWEKTERLTARDLNRLLYLVGPRKFIEDRIEWLENKNRSQGFFFQDELTLLDVEENRIDDYLSHKNKEMVIIPDFFIDSDGQQLAAGVVQADDYKSELGHFLCEQHPEIDFALLFSLTRNNCSLRAVKPTVDLTKVINQYNGGGHPLAAGCDLVPIGMKFLEKVFQQVASR